MRIYNSNKRKTFHFQNVKIDKHNIAKYIRFAVYIGTDIFDLIVYTNFVPLSCDS